MEWFEDQQKAIITGEQDLDSLWAEMNILFHKIENEPAPKYVTD